jgi:hypothetical protein
MANKTTAQAQGNVTSTPYIKAGRNYLRLRWTTAKGVRKELLIPSDLPDFHHQSTVIRLKIAHDLNTTTHDESLITYKQIIKVKPALEEPARKKKLFAESITTLSARNMLIYQH